MRSCFTHSRIGGRFDRRDDLIEHECDGRLHGRIELDLAHGAVEIAGRLVPDLPFAAIHRQLHDMTILPTEGLVSMQQHLYAIRAGGHVGEAEARIADYLGVEDLRLAALPALGIDAEDLLTLRAFLDLKSRLLAGIDGQQQQQSAVERLARMLRRQRDGERCSLRRTKTQASDEPEGARAQTVC